MVYRKKYSGTERPRKMETPTIKRLRMEFMLVNCRKDSPTAAESQIKVKSVSLGITKAADCTHYSYSIRRVGSG